MRSTRSFEAAFAKTLAGCLPHLSVDCVVFGFHDRALEILALKWRNANIWALPGGYVGLRESLDAAARRVLRERTGLGRVHLRQFCAFGALDRGEGAWLKELFTRLQLEAPRRAWPLKRVVSIGYFALVDHGRAKPRVDDLTDACAWFSLDDLPPMAFDHAQIVRRGLEALRRGVDDPSTGATLLPGPFTMPELQRLHEAILGRRLDRRNFQKRLLERGVLERLEERRRGGPHRPPFLYRFAARPGDGG